MRTVLRTILLKPRAQPTAPAGGGGGGGGGSTTTLNPSVKSPNVVLSNGNLTCTGGESTDMVASIGSVASGKFRFEFTPANLGGTAKLSVGVCNASKPTGPSGSSWIGGDSNSCGIYSDGVFYYAGAAQGSDGSVHMAVGTTFGVEVDIAANSLWFVTSTYRSSSPLALPTGTLFAYCGMDSATASCTFNFGGSAWATPVTSGFDVKLA